MIDIKKVAELARKGVSKFKDEHKPVFLIVSKGGYVPLVLSMAGSEDMKKVKDMVQELDSSEYWSIGLGWITKTVDFRKQAEDIKKNPSFDAMILLQKKVLDYNKAPSESEFKQASVVIGHHKPSGSEIWIMDFDISEDGTVDFKPFYKIDQKGGAFISLNIWSPRQFVV